MKNKLIISTSWTNTLAAYATQHPFMATMMLGDAVNWITKIIRVTGDVTVDIIKAIKEETKETETEKSDDISKVIKEETKEAD